VGEVTSAATGRFVLKLVGGIPTRLKNMKGSWELGLLFPIYGKMKNVPNHQPVK